MIEAITTILLVYVAMIINVYIHELGHFGRNIKISFFPIPSGYATVSPLSWGGLAANLLTAYLIFHYQPTNPLILYVGLVSWVHFILYSILGSFNKEVSMKTQAMWNFWKPRQYASFVKTHIFDDVPNELWFIYVPLGIATFWFMKDFYLPILGSIWTNITGVIILENI